MGAIIALQRTSFSVIYCQFIDLSFEKQIAQGVCENRSNTGKQNTETGFSGWRLKLLLVFSVSSETSAVWKETSLRKMWRKPSNI